MQICNKVQDLALHFLHHWLNEMTVVIFFLHLFSLILSSSSCSVTKFVCHKITDGLKALCPFYTNTTLTPSHQKSAAATITHFDLLFNSGCSSHSWIFVCSTFAPFCSHNVSVQPCRQLCLFVKSSCIHLFILSKIQWPAGLNCSSLPSPPQICVSPALPSPSPSSTNSPSLKSTRILILHRHIKAPP